MLTFSLSGIHLKFYSDTLSGILSNMFFLAFYLASSLTFYLASVLTFFLAFYLASRLAFFLTFCLAFPLA